MQAGPDQIIECPNCRSVMRRWTLLSVNNFCAQGWTDGKIIAPMSPDLPRITKCRDCSHLFWLEDGKILGEVEPYRIKKLLENAGTLRPEEAEEFKALLKKIPEAWDDAPYITELSENEYLDALALGLAKGREQESFLRIHAWWAGNDTQRNIGPEENKNPPVAAQRSERASENLSKLLGFLDAEKPDERLMKEEVARELGLFEETLAILKAGVPEEQLGAAERIRSLAEAKDENVRER
jgi:hypothetical protein